MKSSQITKLVVLSCLVAGCSTFGGRGDSVAAVKKQAPAHSIEPSQPQEQVEQKAIEGYQQFLDMEQKEQQKQAAQANPEAPLTAEAERRLTDLQLEQQEQARLKALDEQDRNPAARQKPLPEVDYLSAADTYEELLVKYPDYEHNDEILYQLSRVYTSAGRHDLAQHALDRLVTEYPYSPLYSEAQFRRGESYFLDGDYPRAAEAYSYVLAAGDDTSFYEHSLYKYGWSLYKQSKFEAALDTFFTLLDRRVGDKDFSQLDPLKDLPAPEKESLDDILRSTTLSFYYQNGPDSIDEYLIRKGRRPYEHLLYSSLGAFYLEVARNDDAARTYHAYIDRNPADFRAPLFQMKVIDAYTIAGNAAEVVKAKETLAANYAPNSEFWKHNDVERTPEVMDVVKANIKELAQHYHAMARKNNDQPDFDKAIDYYRLYVKSFPRDPDAAYMNFLLADALSDDHRYLDAANEYERTAYAHPPHDRAAEAGYAALLAYNQYTDTQTDPEEKRLWRRRSIMSAMRFTETFPDHQEATRVLIKTASDLFSMNEPLLAARLAETVVAHEDLPPELLRSAHTVLAHTAFDRGDYQKAETHYLALVKETSPYDTDYQPLVDQLAASIYKQGEKKAETSPEEAAADFLRVRQLAPSASIVANAEYDAAAALIKANAWGKAVEVLERFRNTFPGNKLQKDVTQKLALAYENDGQLGKAAHELEQISYTEQDPDMQREALWQAAEYYGKDGRTQEEVRALTNYIQRYPEPFENAIEARYKLAEVDKNQGNVQNSRAWLKQIVDLHKDQEGTDRTRYLAATAALTLADVTLVDFKEIKLTAPLQTNLKLKRSRMQASLDAYQAASKYGVADVTSAATFHIAELYHDFSSALMDSERPPELSEVELEEYDSMLEEQAMPFEEKSIEIHEVNVQRVSKDRLYNQWIKKSFDELATLYPVRYNKAETLANAVDVLK